MSGVALVTGSGMGIGRAIALVFAEHGYDIALHCRDSLERAYKVQDEIRALGRRCEIIIADLSQMAGVQHLFDEFEKRFDRLDVFVGNAGVTGKGRMLEMDEETFDLMYRVNFKGNYFCMQRAGRLMRDQGVRGSMVLISSNHSNMQHPLCSCYGSLKAGLNKMVKHAAMELGRYGIRVNAIAPGWTDTGEPRLGEKEPTYYHIPLKRWCEPREVGQAALFLSGPYAGSITGATLFMDGGASLQSDSLDRYGYEGA